MGFVSRTLVAFFGLSLALVAVSPGSQAVEPGVDIAAPRVALTNAGGVNLVFNPSVIRVEQEDYVRWIWLGGSHTTTSGPPCIADGLWSNVLTTTSTSFTRQFLEAPGTRPFFCMPHCSLGMTGQVIVTAPIDLAVTDVSGTAQLAWSGGGGLYRVFRSGSAPFGAGTAVLTPAGGTSQTTFSDQTGATPTAGSAFFYLVMNQF
jgi:plastocyanin